MNALLFILGIVIGVASLPLQLLLFIVVGSVYLLARLLYLLPVKAAHKAVHF